MAYSFVDSRGAATWIEIDSDGNPTEYSANKIRTALNLDEDIGTSKYPLATDLSTLATYGSSTMAAIASKLFPLMVASYPDIIKNDKSLALGTTRLGHSLAAMGFNTGSLKFPDGLINNTANSVTLENFYSTDLSTFPVTGTLQNGVTGTLANSTFKADADIAITIDPNLAIEFLPSALTHANAVAIVNLGKNNMGTVGADVLVLEGTRKAVAFLDAKNDRHTYIIGHFVDNGATATSRANTEKVNAWLKSLYTDRYFDLMGYLMSDAVWTDTGLTKTPDDIASIAAKELPMSLALNQNHMSTVVVNAVALKIRDSIINLGWYL